MNATKQTHTPGEWTEEEIEANLRLFAAAPALRAALAKAIADQGGDRLQHGAVCGSYCDEPCDCWVGAARAALALADGKT